MFKWTWEGGGGGREAVGGGVRYWGKSGRSSERPLRAEVMPPDNLLFALSLSLSSDRLSEIFEHLWGST